MTYEVAIGTWHDASIASVKDGELKLLIESERYSHIKHDVMSQVCIDEFSKTNCGDINKSALALLDINSTIIFTMLLMHFMILVLKRQYV